MYYDQKESGKRIALLRKQHGLTQEQLAEKLNITVTYLSKLETGSYGGSIDLLIEIAEVFEVTLDFVVLGKPLDHGSVVRQTLKKKLLQLIEFLMKFVNEL